MCFSPKDNCDYEIIKAIGQTKKQILVQSYIFNDMSIAKALVEAKRKGIDVKVILDKSQIKKQHKIVDFLNRNQIKVIIANYSPAILHNKIIVIDGAITLTGSYNFSYGARRNQENVVLINDTEFTKKYIQNWYECEKHATNKYISQQKFASKIST